MKHSLTLLTLVLVTASASATIQVSSSTTPSNSLASALRGLGGAFWDQNDSTSPENIPHGGLLVSTDLSSSGFGVINWTVRKPFVMDFATSAMTVWGIYSEAGDRNKLYASDSEDTDYVVSNKDSSFRQKTYSITSTTGNIELDLMNASQNTGPFDSDIEIIFGEAMVGNQYYGLFMFDDRYPSLDNHDDFIGLVNYAPGGLTTTPIPEPSMFIGLIAFGFIGWTVRSRLAHLFRR